MLGRRKPAVSPENRAHERLLSRRRPMRRPGWGVSVPALVVFVLVCLAGGFWLRLAAGPISLAPIAPRIERALEERFGAGFRASFSDAVIESTDHGPAIRLVDVSLRDRGGREVIAAPKAEMAFDPLALATGRLAPRRIAFIGPRLNVAIGREGRLTISAGNEIAAAASAAAAARKEADDAADDAARQPALAAGGAGDAEATPFALIDGLFGAAGPFAQLQVVSLKDGRLVVADARQGERLVFDEFDLDVRVESANAKQLSLSARAPSGRFRLAGRLSGEGGRLRRAEMTLTDASIGDMLLPLIARGRIVAAEMPLSGRIIIEGDAEGRLAGGTVALTGGAAEWVIPDDPPARVVTDEIVLEAGFDAVARRLALRRASVLAGQTRLDFTGEAVPAPDGVGYAFTLTGKGAVKGATSADPEVVVDAVEVSGKLDPAAPRIVVTGMRLDGPRAGLALAAEAYGSADGPGLRLTLKADPMPVRSALALWPFAIAPKARTYLAERLADGRVEALDIRVDMPPAVVAAAIAHRPIPHESVSIDFRVSDAVLRAADGLPPLVAVEGAGVVGGRVADITVARARVEPLKGVSLALEEGRFLSRDLGPKVPLGEIDFRISGPAQGFVALLRGEALKGVSGVEADPAIVSGEAEAKVSLRLPLSEALKGPDVVATAEGRTRALKIERVFARHAIEAADLALVYAQRSLTVSGEARFLGTPVKLDVRREKPEAAPQATLAFTLDDAARTRLGFAVEGLSGPVAVKVTTALAGVAPPRAVEIDLTRAAIDEVLPGWSKAAGRVGKISFVARDLRGDRIGLDELSISGGGAEVSGSATLDAGGTLVSARLDQLRLSPGDQASATVERAGNGYRVAIRGGAFDARSTVRGMLAPAGSGRPGRDLEIDARLGTAIGMGGERLSDLNLRFVRAGGVIRSLEMKGRFGRAGLDIRSRKDARGNDVAVIEAADAGAFLRFADLYRRMVGGRLDMTIGLAGQSQAGSVLIRNFRLRDEPAMARVAATAAQAASRDRTDQPLALAPARAAAQDVPFEKLKADFVRSAGRFEIREAAMWGPQIGASIQGSIDYTADRADLSGTFVPAYGLNNMFSQVPVVGLLLGGGQYEGLFAVDFRVTGRASAPTVTINPLSALAPGVLRKILGAVGQPFTGGPAPGGSIAQPPAERPIR